MASQAGTGTITTTTLINPSTTVSRSTTYIATTTYTGFYAQASTSDASNGNLILVRGGGDFANFQFNGKDMSNSQLFLFDSATGMLYSNGLAILADNEDHAEPYPFVQTNSGVGLTATFGVQHNAGTCALTLSVPDFSADYHTFYSARGLWAVGQSGLSSGEPVQMYAVSQDNLI